MYSAVISKTAAFGCFRLIYPAKNTFLSSFSIAANKMGNWEAEKQKYLNMDLNQRRAGYKNYVKCEDIPAWKEFDKGKLLPKGRLAPGNDIDNSKNATLVDKISYYEGDITQLEVRNQF